MDLGNAVFLDSGLGGLSILSEAVKKRKDGSFWYFSDRLNLPYGKKSDTWLKNRSLDIVRSFEEKIDPDLYVIACNTLSVAALSSLRESFDKPFVGVVPAIKPAAEKPAVEKIAILSTTSTSESDYLKDLVSKYAATKVVEIFPSEELVVLAEHYVAKHGGDQTALSSNLKIDALCNQVKAFSPQVIVLGCTHFVFLKEFLQKQLGDGVHFVDSSEAVAKQIDRLLPTSVGLSKAKSEVNILTNVPLSEAEKARIASVCLGHDWSFADWLV